MKKFIALFAAVLVLAALAPKPSDITRSMVQITYGDRQFCTGFVVSASRGVAVTADHCIPAPGGEIFVDGKPSEVLKVARGIALVSVETMTKPSLSIRMTKPELGTPVTGYGYGYGDLMVIRRNVSGFKAFGLDLRGANIVAVDGPFVDGMSGGPLVDDDGRVVGVIQASDHRSFAVGISSSGLDIVDLLRGK